MGAMMAKPDWVDKKDNGCLSCNECSYKTDDAVFLAEHAKKYHDGEHIMILYMECTGSIEGRNQLQESIDFDFIDMTGGQAAFQDGDLQDFGNQLVNAARENGLKIWRIVKMHDPGLGLDFPNWWLEAGIRDGIFQEFIVPNDVKATAENHEENGPESEPDEEKVIMEETDTEQDEENEMHPDQVKRDQCKKSRPLNAYMQFAQSERPKIAKENPDFSVVEIAQEMGKRYQSLTTAEKEGYKQLAVHIFEKNMVPDKMYAIDDKD